MKRIAAECACIYLAVDLYLRYRICVITVSDHVLYVEFRAALDNGSIAAPYFQRSDCINYGITEREFA